MTVEFGLLGPFEVRANGSAVQLGSPKLRILLAALLLHAGRPVPVEELADAVWGQEQPGNPRRAIQLYVTRLRRLSAELDITTRTDAYQINVQPEYVDLGRFHRDLERAARAAKHGDLDGEFDALTAAVAHWRGKPLAGVPSDRLQRDFAPRLHEQHLRAIERRFDIELDRGRGEELLDELVVLAKQNPLRERLWAQLMRALDGQGRRTDALNAYNTVRTRLTEELGIDPDDELQTLYARMLAGSPRTEVTVPRQVPPDVPAFVGRADALAQLTAPLGAPDRPAPVAIALVSGMAGIGKSALAAYWARRAADRFPDGQLWLNLQAFGPRPAVSSDQALTRFLRTLGVSDAKIPLDLDEKTAMFRSLLDGRRMLVVLDNAADAAQVRPLLPSSPGAMVLVTSRNQLSDLVAVEGARSIQLDLLSRDESRQLLAGRLSADRINAARPAADELVDLCARLPLALAVVAARAAERPGFGLEAFVADLRAGQGRLEAFSEMSPATEMRRVFSWSYRELGLPAARLFRLLGQHPGPDFDLGAAASLAGEPRFDVRRLLAELRQAHLLDEPRPGRYALHDLLNVYAGELMLRYDADLDRLQVRRRLLDHYLFTSQAAASTLYPCDPRPSAFEPQDGVVVRSFEDHRAALAWFADEIPALLAVLDQAGDEFPDRATALIFTLADPLTRVGRLHDLVAALQAVLAADADIAVQTRAHRELALAYTRLNRPGDADLHSRLALEASRTLGIETEIARSHRICGLVREAQGRQHEALEHDRQALHHFEAADDDAKRARAICVIAWDLARLGDYQGALSTGQEALALLGKLGDRPGEAFAWDTIGYSHHHLSRYRPAIEAYESALETFQDFGDRYNEADVLVHLGETHYVQGDITAAGEVWSRAHSILADLGDSAAVPLAEKLEQLTLRPTAG
ncbi:BTAD domain-containing putative transcriptional regulator [Kribbella sp. NPDC058693]|uniref:AfsR/SARP family transcriptional regulator n=1 Tax=Kribbella sp. NPDC058693 TaxID=3346602 RepID=UPI00364BDB82